MSKHWRDTLIILGFMAAGGGILFWWCFYVASDSQETLTKRDRWND